MVDLVEEPRLLIVDTVNALLSSVIDGKPLMMTTLYAMQSEKDCEKGCCRRHFAESCLQLHFNDLLVICAVAPDLDDL